jgi:hypothetical protein
MWEFFELVLFSPAVVVDAVLEKEYQKYKRNIKQVLLIRILLMKFDNAFE